MIAADLAPSLSDLVELGVSGTPPIARERWRLDGSMLVCDAPRAFVALGVTLEAIDIALGTVGFAIEPSHIDEHHVALGTERTGVISSRLAASLGRRACGFRTPASRISAHAPARLAAAAARHDCRLAWVDDTSTCIELATLLGVAPPEGAVAIGVLHAPSDARDALVGAGRAATRVYLEADSLGLSASAIEPLLLDDAFLARRYHALVPSEPTDVAVVTSWFGHAR